MFERKGPAGEVAGQWREGTADLSVSAGKSVRVYLEAADAGRASLFEAQVDDLGTTRNRTGRPPPPRPAARGRATVHHHSSHVRPS